MGLPDRPAAALAPRGTGGRRCWKHEAIELKVWRDKKIDPLGLGLEQLEGYLDRLGLTRGTLVIFDRRTDAGPLADRIRCEPALTAKGRAVTVLRA